MGLVSEKTAAEIADGVRIAKGVAHDALDEQIGRRRLRSGSKTRKSRATRERIMTAASELMAERGSTDFQMSEVSARCHMSKGALYYYFSDKDELVEAIFSSVGDDLVSASESIVAEAGSAREALEGLCEEFARRMRTKSTLMLAMTRAPGSGGGVISLVGGQLWRIVSIVERQLELGKGEGFVDGGIDCRMGAVYLVGGLVGTTVVSAGSAPASTDALARKLMGLAMHGVGPRDDATQGEGTPPPKKGVEPREGGAEPGGAA